MQADENMVIDLLEREGVNLYEHTLVVTKLCIIVAKKMKLTAEQIYRLALGALLHDLGLRYITVPYINCDINGCQKQRLLNTGNASDPCVLCSGGRKMDGSFCKKNGTCTS